MPASIRRTSTTCRPPSAGPAASGTAGADVEPLDGLDAAFLALEAGASHLHVAAVLVLDPPEGRRSLFSASTRYAQVRRLVADRIHLAPPLRQRAVRVPFGLQHPVWADDPEFDLDEHLSRASLPHPGDHRELVRLVAEVAARPLDPDRPLWEMVLVEGLEDGRSALIVKVHHAIADGVSGAGLLAGFFDLGPRARLVAPVPIWRPAPLPTPGDLLRHAVKTMGSRPGLVVGTLRQSVDTLADLAAHHRLLSREGRRTAPVPFTAPRTGLNGTISSRRRYATAALDLPAVKEIARVHDATVNDVLLACVAGGLRRLLESRGEPTDRALVAAVPVSTRDGHESPLGNKVSAMLVELATAYDDPVERLVATKE